MSKNEAGKDPKAMAGLYDLDIAPYGEETSFIMTGNYDGKFEKSTGQEFIPEMQRFARDCGEEAIATWSDDRGGMTGQEQIVIMTAKDPVPTLNKLSSKYSMILTSSFFDLENFKMFLQDKQDTLAYNQEHDQPAP